MVYRTVDELEAGMAMLLGSPTEAGTLRLVVRRPGKGQREIVEVGQLDTDVGLVGDDWVNRPGSHSDKPSPYAQVTMMNARVAELISGDPDPAAWAQCGDQLYLDLDLSEANMPAGSRVGIGEAVLEIQAEPHTGCLQFRQWWGADALRFISTDRGRQMRMRGANAIVLQSGLVRPGDIARKL
ncbi:MAG TPA: MOSC domain-containing protein [Anaerolineae bacterium]|nr:MOSC domain-containing protein [Anaerolineae bacterium]